MLFASSSARRTSRTELFWTVDRSERLRLLAELAQPSFGAVVFCRNGDEAARVADSLTLQGVPAAASGQRDFGSARVRVNVLTDGDALPKPAAPLVVQFDPAPNPRQHRRRADLAAERGATVTFVVPERRDEAIELIRRLDAPLSLSPPEPDRVRRAAAATEATPGEGLLSRATAALAPRLSRVRQLALGGVRRLARVVTAWRRSRRRSQEPLP